ncbi:MAG: CDP-alcohol phosphatidyltransferase family protein [Acidimicrobiales bacterium]|jgi:CDP-diacylglycerol---glycerol-3-phosphate 3-phosphatidyltransferase|nr:CDP-alcohol phosphatidyltransferase family protein [Acidimicrobiales bacterium]
MLDGNWRTVVDRGLTPIGQSLQRAGISADVVTVIGIVMASGASVAIGMGNLRLGFMLLVLTGVPDALDGAVAKAAGTASSRGAYFDSVADRLTDALLFGGVAWHLATVRTDRMMMLPVAIMATAMFISYQRAKAESLGYDAKGGLMERAERFIVLAFGLLFFEILVPVLWVMLVLSLITAVQRFVKVWRQATADRELPAGGRPGRRRQLRMERRRRHGAPTRPNRH